MFENIVGHERVKNILRGADGFVYYIMVKGVTGIRRDVASDLDTHIKQIKKHTDLPVAVGFGISKAEHAKTVAKFADAIVVGSALMRSIDDGTMEQFIHSLANVLHK